MNKVIVFLLLSIATASASVAQSVTEVLKGKDITEEALIEAFAPADALPDGVRTRSLKLGRGGGGKRPAGGNDGKPRSKDVLITFETNSAQLDNEGKSSLDRVARAFNSEQLAPLNFAIEGHADPRGGSEDNLKLSQARAESVLNYLVAAKGVNPERLKAIGKGDRELLNTRVPISPENRRVTFVTSAK